MEKKPEIEEETETVEDAIELILFQVPECYVYLIPPRKSAASYRADEWDVNKWEWEGTLKVISKDEECIIRLEDKTTGELYARAFLRNGEPHPVETVIDSSRYFVLRVEENIDGRLRHAFIGIGFRERTEAYDFQAALHDHIKYLDKKRTAEEMEQQFQHTSATDYSLKEGEILVLQLNNKGPCCAKTKISDLSKLSLEEKEPALSIKPLPPPPLPSSPVSSPVTSPQNSPSKLPPKMSLDGASEGDSSSPVKSPAKEDAKEQDTSANKSTQVVPDEDFGDFQAAG
ncbi:Adaptin ear-binding coat-associated protein 1 NECAP-1 [Euphorbia peplus]|nr:Adaptin ear-binding coat-associated protein 1 NECAP-1 [Euphorbia peplus]